MKRRIALLSLIVVSLAFPGCLHRRIRITSEPPGARVWVNDVEIGVTPAETDFVYYGVYDVRLDHPEFEPLMTSREAGAPIWEYPGIDLLAEIAPVNIEHTVDWHFDLVPAPETYADADVLDAELIERARATRSRLSADAR